MTDTEKARYLRTIRRLASEIKELRIEVDMRYNSTMEHLNAECAANGKLAEIENMIRVYFRFQASKRT